MVKVYKRGDKLWLYSRVDGKGYRYSSGYGSENIKYVEKNKDELFYKKHNKDNSSFLPFNEYGRYVIDITSNQRNQFTQKETLQKFNKLCEFFNNTDIKDIKSSMIMQWQNSLDYASKTILNYRSVLNMILEMALADEIIERNPLSSIKPPRKNITIPDYYNLDEINLLIDGANGQFKNLLEFAFFTGMRPSEIIALKWSDINFDDSLIKVSKRIREKIEDMPKGYKERVIDLLPRAKDALERQKDISAKYEYVFVTQYNKRYNTPDTFDVQFKKLCTHLEIRVGRFYDTKHSFSTLMLENNMNETWLTQQLGHTNISITRKHYIGKIKPDFTNLNSKINR